MIAAVTNVLLRQATNIILGLAISVIAARSLGPEGNGVFVFLTVVVPPMLVSLTSLGINYANVYFVARRDISIGGALGLTLRFFLGLSVFGGGCGLVYVILGPEGHAGEWATYVAIASFVPLLLQTLLVSIIQAKQDFRLYSLVTVVPSLAMLVLMTTAFWLFGPTAELALYSYLGAQVIGAALSYLAVKRLHGDEPENAMAFRGMAVKYARYGFFSYLGNLMAFLLQRTNFYFVGLFLGAAPLGIYAIATQMSERLLVLVSSITTVALPRMSAEYSSADGASTTERISRATLLASAAVAALVAILSQALIVILFGAEYQGAVLPLIILLPGTVFTSVARILANDLTARGLPHLNVSTSVFVVVGNGVFSVSLIPLLGLNGAALASTLAAVVNCLVKLEVYRRQSGRDFFGPVTIGRSDLALYGLLVRNAVGRVRKSRHNR